MKNKIADSFDIEANTTHFDANHRGGLLKVNVSSLFPNVSDPVMGAYQNYLGGGMLGAVVGAAQFDPSELSKKDLKTFMALKERIKRYFHDVTNEGHDEWSGSTFEQNQRRAVSGY